MHCLEITWQICLVPLLSLPCQVGTVIQSDCLTLVWQCGPPHTSQSEGKVAGYVTHTINNTGGNLRKMRLLDLWDHVKQKPL